MLLLRRDFHVGDGQNFEDRVEAGTPTSISQPGSEDKSGYAMERIVTFLSFSSHVNDFFKKEVMEGLIDYGIACLSGTLSTLRACT